MRRDTTNLELRRALQELLQQMPPPDWVRQMIDHYRRTGGYRPEDLRRLLGDPTKGIEIGPNTSVASYLAPNDKTAS